jgi:hypothetical protein
VGIIAPPAFVCEGASGEGLQASTVVCTPRVCVQGGVGALGGGGPQVGIVAHTPCVCV